MDCRQIARQDFKEFIDLYGHQYPPEMIRGLKHHARVPMFIDNLAKELKLVEQRLGSIGRLEIKEAVYSLTEFFLVSLKRHYDEMALSDAAKSAIIKKQTEMEELSHEIFEEEPNGATKETSQ